MVTAQHARELAKAHNNLPDPNLRIVLDRIKLAANAGRFHIELFYMTDLLRYNLLDLGYLVQYCETTEIWMVKW
jgi:hypothetical protein